MDCPIFIRLNKRGRAQEIIRPGKIENINISNIIAVNFRTPNIIHGLIGFPVSDITIINTQLKHQRFPEHYVDAHQNGFNIDEAEKAYPCPTMFPSLPSIHYFCRHVENLLISENQMRTQGEDPRTDLYFRDCSGYIKNNSIDFHNTPKDISKKSNLCIIEESANLRFVQNSWD